MNPSALFLNFEPEAVYRESGLLLGAGRCGGKAKGIAFARCTLLYSVLAGKVKFPGFTYVLSTEMFDDFIHSRGLDELYDDHNWERVQERIYAAPMVESLWKDLEKIVMESGGLPMAARSSSLMEDSVSLSFAGKYATCFPDITGSVSDRVEALQRCIKTVWASLFNPSARAYREKHRWDHRMESMAVVLQPLVGRPRGELFYPELAGTLFSRVFRRPTPRVKKEDGLMRLCFGLGTRTVDRNYARVFYQTNPALRPDGNRPEQIADSSQETFDVINITTGRFESLDLTPQVLKFVMKNHRNASAFVERYGFNLLYSLLSDPEEPTRAIFSFPGMPKRTQSLFDLTGKLMVHLETAMGVPVDIEFAYETEGEEFTLLQMRPLASYTEGTEVIIPDMPKEKLILRGNRMVSSGKMLMAENMVYVDPSLYMGKWDPSGVVRAVEEFNTRLKGTPYILVGPGRWGSSNPSLGVPVIYAHICNCGCLVEVSLPQYTFTPELSYGTHFFLDMDNDGTLYLPVFGGQDGNVFADDWFANTPYEQGSHESVRLYHGPFDVYLDGESEVGVVALH